MVVGWAQISAARQPRLPTALRHGTRTRIWTIVILLAIVAALALALYLRAKAPPEAARLLPESDAIVYVHLKPLRTATHFDESPVNRSADLQRFVDATGIVPERDLDAVAFALHRMPNPAGPNGPVAYSEVFIGRFDDARLAAYLKSLASGTESYAGRTVYAIPVEGRTLRVAQLGYDTVAASNMPTAEQIHSMLDRSRASALGTPGSSLLAARYGKVPLFAEAWGIGHIGLPFGRNGNIALFGLELPLPVDTDLVASLRFAPGPHLRVEEFAPSEDDARKTADAMGALLGIARGLAAAGPASDPAAQAVRQLLDQARVEQSDSHAILSAAMSLEQARALAAAHASLYPDEPQEPLPPSVPARVPSKH